MQAGDVDAARAGHVDGVILAQRQHLLERLVGSGQICTQYVDDRGVPGMTVTNTSTGAWFGVIRVLMQEPAEAAPPTIE